MTKKRYFFKGYKVPVYVKTGILETQSELKRENRGKNATISGTMSKAQGVEGIFGEFAKSTQRASRKRQDNAL